MDGGPFRAPQQSERRNVVSKSEATVRRQSKVARDIDDSESDGELISRVGFRGVSGLVYKVLLVFALILIIFASGLFVWKNLNLSGTNIDKSKFQAVFLDNGQTFFGKLSSYNGEYMKLTDIYYLQPQEDNSTSAENQSGAASNPTNFTLIKYGNEVYGPEDEMIISRDKILYYENLKPDGKVAKSIGQLRSSN